MGNAALRLPDAHDHDTTGLCVALPCPSCNGCALDDNVCPACKREFCQECGKVDVTGVSVCCEGCAPIYRVHVGSIQMHETRSLRRAWEAQRYYDEAFNWEGASLLNPNRSDFDSDGLTSREQDLLDSWETWGPVETRGRTVRACLPVHLCVMREGLAVLDA